MDNLEKTDYISNLIDLYGSLLTPYQLAIIALYYHENFSLAEIANEYKVSRNAVFTLIKRVEKMLSEYEEKLHILQKNQEIEKVSEVLDEKTKQKIINIINK